jgi:hypothetical protein
MTQYEGVTLLLEEGDIITSKKGILFKDPLVDESKGKPFDGRESICKEVDILKQVKPIIPSTILLLTMLTPVAQAAVLHISQGDTVYYGDVVDMRGVVGLTNNISWWAVDKDNTVDPPDHIISFGLDPFYPNNISAYKVTGLLEPGLWYQWEGYNERKPVVAFYLKNGVRPVNETPVPTPSANTSLAPVVVRTQPLPVADFLIARRGNLTWDAGAPCRVWVIGPSLDILGNQTDGNMSIAPLALEAGSYSLIIQYPDANEVYEVFRDGEYIDSIWKGVDAVWIKPLGYQPLLEKLDAMFGDSAHFHGRIVKKSLIVQEPAVDITAISQNEDGVSVSGTTNLARGEEIKVIFDEEKNVVATDLRKATFYANVTGDDPGALRVWKAKLLVNLQTEPIGTHFITAYPVGGEKVVVPFYVTERFEPFDVPAKTFKFIDNNPFIPTPTPERVEVPVTVIQTQIVTVEVTPAYEVVLAAQTEAAASQRKALEGNLIMAGLLIGLIGVGGYGGYRGIRYLAWVVRRARGRG